MKSRYFIFAGIGFALVLLMVKLSDVSIFLVISPICLIATLGISIIISLALYSPTEIVEAFRSGLTSSAVDVHVLKKGILFFKTFQIFLILSGIFTTLLGTVIILANLDDVTKIGSSFAMALLTLLYSTWLIFFVTIPFTTSLQKKLLEQE